MSQTVNPSMGARQGDLATPMPRRFRPVSAAGVWRMPGAVLVPVDAWRLHWRRGSGRGGGTGRREGLKNLWAATPVGVRFPLPAPPVADARLRAGSSGRHAGVLPHRRIPGDEPAVLARIDAAL